MRAAYRPRRGANAGHGRGTATCGRIRPRKRRKPPEGGSPTKMSRRRPTLPPRLQGSTIGAGWINFRVRNGTGCLPSAMATETVVPPPCSCVESPLQGLDTGVRCGGRFVQRARAFLRRSPDELDSEREHRKSSPRPISTGRLNVLPRLHLRPINLVVCEGPYLVDPVGDLILGRASHLDAFSAYPCRTWLTSRAAGATTGTPEVRPPRSSRTRGSSPQISYAHDG